MFGKNGKKRNGHADLNLGCQVDGCDFSCDDYKVLQKHANKMHGGLQLQCKAIECDYVCSDYVTLERHTSWAHAAVAVPVVH